MKFCAVCQTAHARFFCAADQAFICAECDKKIHENKVSSRHERFPICALCENEPAKIFCKNDDAYLCENCDAEIHSSNPLAARHERMPVTAITSEYKADVLGPCPDIKVKVELPELTSNHTPDNGESCQTGCCLAVKAEPKSQMSTQQVAPAVTKGGDKELEAFLDWDGAILDLGLELDAFESEIMANNLSSADAVVPIVESAESSCSGGSPRSVATKQESIGSPTHNVGVPTLMQAQVPPGLPPSTFPVAQPPFVGHTMGPYAMTLAVNPMTAGWPAAFGMPQDTLHINREDISTKENRHQSINRYREKKKRRVFEKTIRYQSRKAYAEIRPRIKGRFAKREEVAAMVASGVLDVAPDPPTDLSDDLVVPVF